MSYDEIESVHLLLQERDVKIDELREKVGDLYNSLSDSRRFRCCPNCRKAFADVEADIDLEGEPFDELA